MIRKATEKEVEILASIEINSGYEFRKKIDLKKEIKRIKEDFKRGCEFFVFEDKERMLAYASLLINNKNLHIDYLSVLKKYHGKGIGKKFKRFFEIYAKKMGCRRILTEVNNKNFPMIGLNAKFGYVVVDIMEKKNNGKKVKKLLMEKLIS